MKNLKRLAQVTPDDFVGKKVLVAQYDYREAVWRRGNITLNRKSSERIARAVKTIAEKLLAV